MTTLLMLTVVTISQAAVLANGSQDAPAEAPELARQIKALRPREVAGREKEVLDNLEQRAARALASIPRARTRQEADAARPALRARLEQALGLSRLPWPPSLHASTLGTLARHGFRIEKVVYQTLPGMLVPAHLYLPDGLTRPAPAVLFYPGHWWVDSKAQTDFQVFCVNMARLGFVVLTFDPFGQGERGVSARDHRRTEALLVGVAQQGIAVYETRCALEYLLSRPEVDPKRIGITGASGGGYNTWITAALDDRIAVAVPVVGTSEFAEQIEVCRPLDWYQAAEHCHFVPGLLRFANNQELLAMSASRPLLIVAAERDESFPVAGVRAVAEYGRALYHSYCADGRIRLVIDSSEGHGYQKAKREAAYGWFLRWLMNRGDGSSLAELPTDVPSATALELRVFPAGQNQAAGPAIVALVERLARDLPPQPADGDLERALGAAPPPVRATPRLESTQLQRLLIPTEPGIAVPAFLLRPTGEIRGVLMCVDDRGKEALATDPIVLRAFRQGWVVCGIDPRGIGESASSKKGWIFAVSLLLGENFVGRQAWDLHRALEFLGTPGACPNKPAGLYARGQAASLMATYAIALERPPAASRSRLHWYLLRDGFVSFRAWFERPRSLAESYRLLAADRDRLAAYDREVPAEFFVFDGLRAGDLSRLLAGSPAKGLIVNPIDGDWTLLAEALARRMLPPRIRVIAQAEPDAAVGRFVDEVLIDSGPVTRPPP
jgi:dienelactone hydrolase